MHADLGANLECDEKFVSSPDGTAFSVAFRQGNPRVALLNIGEEEQKGTIVFVLLRSNLPNRLGVNYQGFVEGSSLLMAVLTS